MSTKLSIKQDSYCTAMFKVGSETFGNGQKSAKAAGYQGNKHTLESISTENLSKPAIIARKKQIQAKDKAKITADWDYITKKHIQTIDELPLGHTNVQQALDKLGKHLNYYDADNKSKVDKPLALTEEQIAELKRMALDATNIKLRTG